MSMTASVVENRDSVSLRYSLPVTKSDADAFESALRHNGRDSVLRNELVALAELGIGVEEQDFQQLGYCWSPRTKDSRLSDLWYPRVEKDLEKDAGVMVICPQGTHQRGQVSVVVIDDRYGLTLGMLPMKGDLSSHTNTRRARRILSQSLAGLDWWELNARWRITHPRDKNSGPAIGELVFVYRYIDTIQSRIPVDKGQRDIYQTQLPLGGKRDFASDIYPVSPM